MFSIPTEAIVNTVNCVGVMGKGVALQFKKRWPANYKAYKKLCEAKKLKPGELFIFDTQNLFSSEPRFLVNFPTKNHWRSRSELSFVADGLDALRKAIRAYGFKSIVVPPLGCGNGGLDWSEVKPLIVSKLSDLDDVEIIVIEPQDMAVVPEHVDSDFQMTFERALLLKSLGELEGHFDGTFDRISLQKIVYFLQALGANYRLAFSKNLHGPYSDALRKAFVALDRSGMIQGFRTDERQASVTAKGYALADEYLVKSERHSSELLGRLDRLIQGYESPYGLELLSSVHWLAHHEGHSPLETIIEEMRSWNESKRNSFSDEAIRLAYSRLKADGLLSEC